MGQARLSRTRKATAATASESSDKDSAETTAHDLNTDPNDNTDNNEDSEKAAGIASGSSDTHVETDSAGTAHAAANASADDNPGTAAASSTVYKDGTFTGTGFGYEGNISVNVTIENDKIISLEFAEYDDDPDYRVDGNEMLANIYMAQTGDEIVTDVDTVSGATFTSEGVLDAFLDALDAAMN